MKERARNLGKKPTDAEKLIWSRLRNRQMAGWKFRRQFPIGSFIVDFVCLELKMVIELDGGQHAANEVYDNKRTECLETNGFTVLRFWNNEVLGKTDAVLDKIYEVVNGITPPSPRPFYPREAGAPARGEGESRD